jgi:hypothetical protein
MRVRAGNRWRVLKCSRCRLQLQVGYPDVNSRWSGEADVDLQEDYDLRSGGWSWRCGGKCAGNHRDGRDAEPGRAVGRAGSAAGDAERAHRDGRAHRAPRGAARLPYPCRRGMRAAVPVGRRAFQPGRPSARHGEPAGQARRRPAQHPCSRVRRADGRVLRRRAHAGRSVRRRRVVDDGARRADDYASDPAGDAGDRIACGVVSR